MSRRTLLRSLAAVPLFLALPSGLLRAAQVRIQRLRDWLEDEESKRLVLDLDAEARFNVQLLEDPPRVSLTLFGAELVSSLSQRFDDPVVRLLTARQDGEQVHLVIELSRDCHVEVFHQGPSGTRGHRIVIDVAPRWNASERAARDAQVRAVRDSGDKVVAIDPGHGGEDPGTVFGRLKEKHIALSVGQLLRKEIEARARMRAVLTRDNDSFLPLQRRQAVARQYGANVFVSLHVNSAPTQARGAEVFFLSPQGSVDKAARELVDRENAADLVGGVPPEQVNAPVLEILMDMTRNQTMKDSEKLAEILLEQLARVRHGTIRNVKQGPLAVLKSIDKPSVLVELGFITSEVDRRLLASVETHRLYAARLAEGIAAYLA